MSRPQTADPSPEEIRAACLAYQATWSDEERFYRMRGGREACNAAATCRRNRKRWGKK